MCSLLVECNKDVLMSFRTLPLVVSSLIFFAYGLWQILKNDTAETTTAYVGGQVHYLSSPASGKISQLYADTHSMVKQGQSLLLLDSSALHSKLIETEAERKITETDRFTALSAKKHSEVELLSIRKRAENLSMQLQNDRRIYQRAETVFKQGLMDINSLDKEKREVLNSEFKLQELDTEINRHSHLIIESDYQASRYAQKILMLDAQISEIQRKIKESLVVSPVNGVVVDVSRRQGEYVSDADFLISVLDSENIWIDAYFDEDALPYLKVGGMVSVRVDVFSNEVLTGYIESLSAVIGAQRSPITPNYTSGYITRTAQRVPVRIRLNEKRLDLRPGMSAKVSLHE